MKKLTTLFFAVFFFHANSIKAQITLDTIIPDANTEYFFKLVQISDSETKYFSADTSTNTFSLYNMDFTPFLMNVAVPEPFIKPGNPIPSILQPIYITRTLFDCDSTNIEYAYECDAHTWNSFYIMRTDGTQLFMLDSANGPYCYGCFGASDYLRPIRKTSSGYKLFLQRYWGGVQIYSLCGSLPTEIFDFNNTIQSYLKIFPNPTSNSLTFQIDLPDNMNQYELVIVDNNAKAMRREKLHLRSDKYSIDVSNFSSGTYFYSLCTKDKTYQTGKFVINK